MRVVLTLTTLPSRYSKLELTLSTIPITLVDAIYLGLPKQAKRTGQVYPPLPDQISKLVTVVPLDVDYGPICKLLGGLLSEQDPDTLIISIDDDCTYHPDLIPQLKELATRYPNTVIAASGLLIGKGFPFIGSFSASTKLASYLSGFNVPVSGRPVDIICGFAGVAYRRSFFPEPEQLYPELLKYTEHSENLFCNDDVLISAYLSGRQVERKVFSQITPLIDANELRGVKDGQELSYSRMKFLKRFSRALVESEELGFFSDPEDVSWTETIPVRIIIIALVVLIILILIIAAVATPDD